MKGGGQRGRDYIILKYISIIDSKMFGVRPAMQYLEG